MQMIGITSVAFPAPTITCKSVARKCSLEFHEYSPHPIFLSDLKDVYLGKSHQPSHLCVGGYRYEEVVGGNAPGA